MVKTQTWIDVAKPKVNNQGYYEHYCRKYKHFLEMVDEETTNSALEVGCGVANTTKYLLDRYGYHSLNFDYSDISQQIINLASKNLGKEFNNNFLFDVFSDRVALKYTTIHSCQLLHLFNDKDVVKIVNNLFRSAKTQIHTIPSLLYKEAQIGGERLLSGEKWYDILEDFETEVYEFGNGYDLILKIKK